MPTPPRRLSGGLSSLLAGVTSAATAPIAPEVLRAVKKAVRAGLEGGPRLDVRDATTLLSTRKPVEVALIGAVADAIREENVGNRVGYVINRNINFTNSCVKRCGFCAFSRTGVDKEAYFLPTEEVVRRAKEAVELGATEVCIQAGLPPGMKPDLYIELAHAVKAAVPSVHLHAFSPEEVIYGARRSKRTVKEMLRELKEAGLDTIPGTSAEILDDNIRSQIAGQRLSSKEWVDVVRTAHSLGIRSSSTMMYGHIEEPEHVAQHLLQLRDVQDETGGFTEFVPLSFVAAEAPMYAEKRIPKMRAGPSGSEVLLTHSVSRLVLNGSIDNIQCSWPKEGMRMAQVLLGHGVNDLGGVLMNESISTSAGATYGQLAKPKELRELAQEVGREAYQRTTCYDTVRDDFDDDELLTNEMKFETTNFGSYKELIAAKTKWRAKEMIKRSYSTTKRNSFGRRRMHTSHNPKSREGLREVTYSQSHTIVPTYECFNKCTYCNFRTDIGSSGWISLEEVEHTLKQLSKDEFGHGEGGPVDEILILSGEVHPKAKNRAAWHRHIVKICEMALDHGFLPHTNAGPLSFEEMKELKSVNASMGLMVEQTSARLLSGVHRFAPSKKPEYRLDQLRIAGELAIPFTTGLLLGLGETPDERVQALEKIAEIAEEYHHIQEVILQPYSPGGDRYGIHAPEQKFNLWDLPNFVEQAREILPKDVSIQVPPNLLLLNDDGTSEADGTTNLLVRCLEAGANDLGGISPKDEVNPKYDFPNIKRLKTELRRYGFSLKRRLCVHHSRVHMIETERAKLNKNVDFEHSPNDGDALIESSKHRNEKLYNKVRELLL